jgi:hypothetical protein
MDALIALGLVAALLAAMRGPLVLLFVWKDEQRWRFLGFYAGAWTLGAIISVADPNAHGAKPAELITVTLAWRRVYKQWRARRAPIVLAAAQEVK